MRYKHYLNGISKHRNCIPLLNLFDFWFTFITQSFWPSHPIVYHVLVNWRRTFNIKPDVSCYYRNSQKCKYRNKKCGIVFVEIINRIHFVLNLLSCKILNLDTLMTKIHHLSVWRLFVVGWRLPVLNQMM